MFMLHTLVQRDPKVANTEFEAKYEDIPFKREMGSSESIWLGPISVGIQSNTKLLVFLMECTLYCLRYQFQCQTPA